MASSSLSSMVAAYLHRHGLSKTLSAFLAETHTDFSEDEDSLDLDTLYNNYASTQTGFEEPRGKASSDKGGKKTKYRPPDAENKEKSRQDLVTVQEMLDKNKKASRVKGQQANANGVTEVEIHEQECVLKDKKASRKSKKENNHPSEGGGQVNVALHPLVIQMTGWMVDPPGKREEPNGKHSSKKEKKRKKNHADDGENKEESREETFTAETFEEKQKKSSTDKGQKVNANGHTLQEMQEQERVVKEKKTSRKSRKGHRHQTEEDGTLMMNQSQANTVSKPVDKNDWMVDSWEERGEPKGKLSFEKVKKRKKNQNDDEQKEEKNQQELFRSEKMLEEKAKNASPCQGQEMNVNEEMEHEIQEHEYALQGKNSSKKNRKENKLQTEEDGEVITNLSLRENSSKKNRKENKLQTEEDGEVIMNLSLRDRASEMVDLETKDHAVNSQEEKEELENKKRKKERSHARRKEESLLREHLYTSQEIMTKGKKKRTSRDKGHDDVDKDGAHGTQEQCSGEMKEEDKFIGQLCEEKSTLSKLLDAEENFSKVKMVLEGNYKQLREESNAAGRLSEVDHISRAEKKSKDKGRQVYMSIEDELKSIKDQECELKDKQSSTRKKRRKDSKYKTEDKMQEKQLDDTTSAPEKSMDKIEEMIETDASLPSGCGFTAAEVVGIPRQLLLNTEGSKSKKSITKSEKEDKNNRDRLDQAKSFDVGARMFEADHGVQLEEVLLESKGEDGRNVKSDESKKHSERAENKKIQPAAELITCTNQVADVTAEQTIEAAKIESQNGKHTGVPQVALEVVANPKDVSGNKQDNINSCESSKKDNVGRNAKVNCGSIEDPASKVDIDGNNRKSMGDRPPSGALSFKRVDPSKVEFADPRLKDNSYWAMDKHREGWGAKAQEVLQQVRGKNFRHEKTKKKRGTYTGGAIDLQAHSIKFNYSDDEE